MLAYTNTKLSYFMLSWANVILMAASTGVKLAWSNTTLVWNLFGEEWQVLSTHSKKRTHFTSNKRYSWIGTIVSTHFVVMNSTHWWVLSNCCYLTSSNLMNTCGYTQAKNVWRWNQTVLCTHSKTEYYKVLILSVLKKDSSRIYTTVLLFGK